MRFTCFLSLLLLGLHTYSQDKGPFFLSNPCLSPDGTTVVFSFEGDLWRAGTKGGQAVRLTAMQGYETNPRYSPDGKWIAFTGRQNGNADVYIMPSGGGEIRQLTWHSSGDVVNSWSWDSRSIYFTSDRMGRQSGFKVSIDGGTPVRVFGDYLFLYDHNLFEHPSSGEIFFNDTWESSNQVQRKHYKGPFNPDVQSYNPKAHAYKRYTDYAGKDFGATLDRKGNIYFISDEGNGEYNLYTFKDGKKTALTTFKSSIKNAIVNAEGGEVVFEKDYQLYLYDIGAGSARKLDITLARNYVLPKEKEFDIKGKISALDLSPDGKKLALVSRGELFVSDAEGKFIRKIERGSAERVWEVKWLADNKTLLFNQTAGGYLNWYTIAADGSAPLKQLTNDMRSNRSMAFNKTKTKGAYLSGRDEVRLMDLKTFESKTIAKDEIWAFQTSDPGFSPDGRYVYYTAHRNFEQDIFVYDIVKGASVNLTNTGVSESDPIWSADGKYIYFTSARLRPSYPFGMRDPKVYRLPLEKFSQPFRSDKYDELFKTQKKDSTKKDSLAPVVIDAVRIMERIEQVGPSFGDQYLVDLIQKGEKTNVLFLSNQDQGRAALWKTAIEPFEQNKTEKITGAEGGNINISAAGDKYYVLLNGSVYKLNLDQNKLDALALSFPFRKNLSGEFAQVFQEAWARLEENYYDEHFHGLDWKAARDHYSTFLPYLNSRQDLRVLLNDLLGELNSSHQGFSSFGDEEEVQYAASTMETGILFTDEDPYKVKSIVARSAADMKEVEILPGDELVKVDGIAVDKHTDRSYYFTHPSLDREVKLTFSRKGQPFEVELHPQSFLGDDLYDAWIDDNRRRVTEKSKGRIAYTCMKNMGTQELEHFIVDMTQELNGKDGLILDLRYNTGGNVHDEVLKFLSQRSYLQWKYRGGQLTTQGNFTPADKPIVLLINEQSLSDAEMTSAGFKALKLGKIIGNETYHWIIFTSGAGLVDGSFVRLPSWGCYTLDGKDIEATGVTPDIKVINTFEDKINGRDPQVDTAVEEVLSEIKK
jgi:Tol biopolymer transport system component/C-terminal processing protease CtpA/Prc